MKIAPLALVALLAAAPATVAPLLRDSNSGASTSRGIKKYDKKDHAAASKAFDKAEQIDGGSLSAFNAGTAHVASGDLQKGSTELSTAARDESIAADAHYNMGNAALQSRAWGDAIREYSETLRRRPDDSDAKRNLEIALLRRQQEEEQRRQQQQQQQQQSGDQKKPSSGDQKDEKQPGSPNEADKGPGKQNLESILRSVQQQEKEELNRMRHGGVRRDRNW